MKHDIRIVTAGVLLLAAVAQAQDRPPTPPWTKDAPQRAPAQLPREPKLRIAWDRYYHIDELQALQRKLAETFPDLVSNRVIGKSVEGRDLLLTVVNDSATGKDTDKPAFWCDGNIHGNEVQGGEACLYLVSYLCENRDLPQLKELLSRAAFYVLPSVNPDGRAHWFDAPNTMHSSRGGKRPIDNDRDGSFDEDPPNDLDGDGEILQMRVRDPDGPFRTDPEDPRLMVRVKPGEQGEFRIVGEEGIDDDGDGEINEDGPGGYDPNRDWPAMWRSQHEQGGAGPYPLSLPESRAVAEFLVAHENVAGFQSFHNNGGMILRGPGAKSFGDYPRRDERVMADVGAQGERMLPFYRSMVIWKDLYQVYGGEVNFAYETLGIFAYSNEMWSSDQYFSKKGGNRDETREDRRWFEDHLEHGARYVDWKPFHHPTLGDIELGGWRKETGRVAPPFLIEEMLHRNAAFVIFHAEQMPHVAAGAAEVTDLGDDFRAVTVTFRNEGRFPTRSQRAADKHIGAPDRATLTGPSDLHIVSSGIVRGADGRVPDPQWRRPSVVKVEDGIDGNGTVRVRWIVRGRGSLTVTYASPKGGTVEQRVELR